MADPVSYASFMIRVWRDPDGPADAVEAVWVGEVESVQSGRVVSFRGVEALVDLLVGRLGGPSGSIEGGVGSADPTLL